MSKFLGLNFIVDSSAVFLRNTTFNSSTYLHGNTFISNPALATGGTYNALVSTTVGSDALIKYITLGGMALEASTSYVQLSAFESSIGGINSRLGVIDTSISALNASMGVAFTKNANQDTSINTMSSLVIGHEASLGKIDASINKLFTIASSARGATNGVTILPDGSYGLGGSLNTSTTINVSEGLTLSGAGSTTFSFDANGFDLTAQPGIFDQAQITGEAGKLSFLGSNTNGGVQLYIDATSALYYDSDNTAIFDMYDRSVPDAGWVKAQIGSSLDASILEIYTYIDGSLADRDASIQDAFIKNNDQDTSINNVSILTIGHEASLGKLDGSVNKLFTQNANQDSSINNLSILTIGHEASLGKIDASVNKLFTNVTNLNSSLGLFVLKAGDTMTGGLKISAGGLDVVNDVCIGGSLIVSTNLSVAGNLTVDGSVTYINTQTLNVSDNFISVNYGMSGTPPVTLQSGIKVNRGSLEPYVFLFDETIDTFRIGIASETSTGFQDASTQAVATREDTPLSRGLSWWDASTYMFKTAQLQAGSGVTITQTDTSILIAVTGAAVYTKKYSTTFNGTAYDSSTITAATHALGTTGPFAVAVYDNNVLVYPDVAINGSGDVTITWAPGSMGASGSLIITG